MVDENTIKALTRQVMSELSIVQKSEEIIPQDKQVLFIMTTNTFNIASASSAILDLQSQKIPVISFLCGEACSFSNNSSLSSINDCITDEKIEKIFNFHKTKAIILFTPTYSLCQDLISLNDKNRVVRFLLRELTNNVPVYMVYNFLFPNTTLSSGIQEKLSLLQKNLIDFSIHLLSLDDIRDFLNTKARIKKKVITEIDMIHYYKKGLTSILLEKNCIVTPLAKDKAREFNINLIRIGE